ncbi:MAG: hypothetical protein II641_04455, partial [Clostridiales bacterium]|nr:hypothetical protein [Clostridiales bacterium]
ELDQYMLDNGFGGYFYIEIKCTLVGEQDFDVYYKGTKITTLTLDCKQGEGTLPLPESVSQMYGDVSKYEDNMTDYELISAGCYWIRNHSYRDYTCWGCQVVGSMMLMKGYPSVILSCSQYVDGKIINDYSNYYAVCYKNRNDCSGGHRVCLIFVSPTEYMFIEVQGSSGLAKGETSFKQPWERIIPVPKSIYDKVSWLRDYDTVYDMVLGDYGIDLATYDPYDCSTWC